MPLAHSIENYLYGKGRLYFKKEGDSGYLDLGNIPNFAVSVELEKVQHFSSQTKTKEKDKEFVSQKTAKSSFAIEEYSPENLNIAFLGDTIQEEAQSAGYLDQDSVTVVDDRYVDLGKMYLSSLKINHGTVTGGPFEVGETITGGSSSATAEVAWEESGFVEVVNISGTFTVGERITGGTSLASADITKLTTQEDVVCVNATTPTTRYVKETDYTVDADAGLFRALSGGAITTTCYVSADYGAKTLKSVRALKNSSCYGELLFMGDPGEGPVWKIQGWKTNLLVSGEAGFISEDIASVPMEAEFLSDQANHPNEPFFRATNVY